MPVVIASQFKFQCPLCGWSITLPRRSQLGAYVGEKYNPNPKSWPMQWVCIPHESVCQCQSDKVKHIELEEQSAIGSPAALWEIECHCGQATCDKNFTGYTLWDLDATADSKLIDRLVEAKPKAAKCSAGHEIEWQSEKIKATMLPF